MSDWYSVEEAKDLNARLDEALAHAESSEADNIRVEVGFNWVALREEFNEREGSDE